MDVLREIKPARDAVLGMRESGMTVGLVPTMGALHEGHLSLIRTARRDCSAVAVTIFVNPAQFGPNEDLAAYPRAMDQDLSACQHEGVDLVFAPSDKTMYPEQRLTSVHVAGVSDGLCGPFRPGHFDGVASVVAKLFNILPAHYGYFGEKDYQQLAVIQHMVRDLDIPIEIVPCPTVRAEDGLALSSRNAYLSAAQRKQARSLSQALFHAAHCVAGGFLEVGALVIGIREQIELAGPCDIEYVKIVGAHSLEPLTTVDRPVRICLAVRIGSCRLIDNVAVTPPRWRMS